MLVNCPECNLQVSDRAVMCPHCGYPLRPNDFKKISRRPNRRKRLPNGFGQISEIKGRGLRKPFRAMVTVGKNEFGRPICRLLQAVEIEALWKNINRPYVDIILIQCYSGWRPQELASLKLENINLENRTMTGGMKTDAGSDRIVPIHSKIYPLVERKYKEAKRLNSSYLFNRKNKPFTYATYRFEFNKIVEELDLNPHHKPHDPRKYFVSACKKYNVDEYAIKYMVGHTITDITERVYTKRDLDWLKKELEKLK